jgi:hypothetical protein
VPARAHRILIKRNGVSVLWRDKRWRDTHTSCRVYRGFPITSALYPNPLGCIHTFGYWATEMTSSSLETRVLRIDDP